MSKLQNTIIRFLILWLVAGVCPAQAQSLHTAISAQAKVTDKLNVTAHLSRRSFDEFKGTSKSNLSLSANYTFSPHISVAAGTALVMHHARENTLSPGLVRPSYWQPRWRTFISVSPRIFFSGFNAFYRSRLQVLVKGDKTLRLQPTDDPYQIDGETTFTWTHRLYIERPIKKFTPYVSFDLFNSIDNNLDVTQYQFAIGTYFFFNHKNRFGLFGRRIFKPDKSKPADGLYVIGVTYQFRFSI